MVLLALDTTTRAGSAAVVADDRLVAEHELTSERSYAEQLPGTLLSVLACVGVELSAVDVFAVAAGPGSFTGLRIGIATIQGLAFTTGRRIVTVSALEALAHAGSRGLAPGELVGAWMDAHRRDVFAALYRVADAPSSVLDRLVELESPSIGSPAAIMTRWAAEFGVPAALVGDGAVAYEAMAGPGTVVKPTPTLAGTIGRVAAGRARLGQTIDPAAVQPLYVRRSDAEIGRDLAGRNAPPRQG